MDTNRAIDLSEIEQIVKEKTEQHEGKSKFLKPNFDKNNKSSSSGIVGCESNGRSSGVSGTGELDFTLYENPTADEIDENLSEANIVEVAKEKRIKLFAELISSEQVFIRDLSTIVNGYIAELQNPKSDIPIPEDLKGVKERMVFGNIVAIYEWHRDHFIEALKRCVNSPADMGAMLRRYEHKFQMHTVYVQNIPVSEHIISSHAEYFAQVREKLGIRLGITDFLIKPMQRITRYNLLFMEILKQTKRAGLHDELASMEECYRVTKAAGETLNDAMILRRLQKFEGKISAQGKLLLYGPLMCIEDAKSGERNAYMVQKPRELQVFLLEQSIIFTDIDGKKAQYTEPLYNYRSHIQVNKMQLEELPNNRFLLKSTDPNRPDLNLICYAATVDSNNEWVKTIRNILQSQRDFLLAITSPIQYQKELTKET